MSTTTPPQPQQQQRGRYILHTDSVFRVEPGQPINYNANNPLVRLLGIIQGAQVAAEREHYLMESVQYLVPYSYLELYGPQSPNQDNLTPEAQDFKTDFQKQNIKDFVTTDAQLMRGLSSAGNWNGTCVR
jgi:hypothetical protein